MIKPTFNRLLVEVLVDIATEVKATSVMVATVLDVGPDVQWISMGETVMFSPYGFDEVMDGERKLIIIEETLILCTKT